MNIYLSKPKKIFRESFLKYVDAYKKINDDDYYNKYKDSLIDFDKYIGRLSDLSKGINLGEDEQAYTTYWLIRDSIVVGVVRLRHESDESAGHIGYDISPDYRRLGYGNLILKLIIPKAKERGISRMIVTCNTENIGSKKIIEKNKGVLIDTYYDVEENEHLYRYYINIL